MTQPVPANLPMTVKLEAQHWNVVIMGLRKLPYELVEFVLPAVNEQLAALAQAQGEAPMPATNGLDLGEQHRAAA